ncbi:cytochrome P450 monooxygenase [Phyllosticta citribraziliensis]|uniref:Cytochrome P450 monooxygenase n=1 Tax=Phyllosticta citribraziliensis TaxID=989973 RepID=A0ABR1LDW2_9PEZI
MIQTVSLPSALALVGASVLFYFVVFPCFEYIRDPKGLRKFPNMTPLAAISNLPFMLLAYTGARSSHLVQMHKKHPVIRIGPNALSYGDTRAIKDIYGHNTKCIKDGQYRVGAGEYYHLADVIDRKDHARKRKYLSAAYAIKNLEGWEAKVLDKTVRLMAHMDKCCTDPLPKGETIPREDEVNLDWRKWANYFSLDAIADIGLSERLGFLDTDDDRVTVSRPDGSKYTCHLRECLYDNARKQSYIIWSYDWYKVLDKLTNYAFPSFCRMGHNGQMWDGIPTELTTRRLKRYQAGEPLEDFFSALMKNKYGEDNNVPFGEVVSEMNIMLNAGSVTTALALTNVLFQLLKHPEVLQKLRDELDEALDPDEVYAPYPKIKHLPYLKAVLDESLRLFPPTPHNLPRETPSEGCRVLDDWIPGGTTVGMSALVAHRDEKVWHDAEKFIPERWLGDKGKSLQSYFLSFSAGARGCIGRNITYLEQEIVLASIVRRYDFALPHPEWDLQREETMNWLIKDMPVKVWRRDLKVAE